MFKRSSLKDLTNGIKMLRLTTIRTNSTKSNLVNGGSCVVMPSVSLTPTLPHLGTFIG